ncbi:general transcription factor IIIA [Microdochium nivale]|nr:general transcription factor IIIA [Microdochium nivale]
MSTAENNSSDVFDPDAVLPQNSPILTPQFVNLKPSPSPPLPLLAPLTKIICFADSDHKHLNCKHDVGPDPGDAVLIKTLAGGKLPDGTHQELARPLQELGNYRKPHSPSEGSETDDSRDSGSIRSREMSPVPLPALARSLVLYGPNKLNNASPVLDLQSLASHANQVMKCANVAPNSPPERTGPGAMRLHEPPSRTLQSPVPMPIDIPCSKQPNFYGRGPIRSASITSMSSYSLPGVADLHGSPPTAPAQPTRGLSEATQFSEQFAGGPGGLPPIQMASPPSDTNSLPSIRSQFHDQLNSGAAVDDQRQKFPQSPPVPGVAPRLGSIHGSRGSPPVSPTGGHHAPMGGYIPSCGTDMRHLERSPSVLPPIDRMSIDSVTNPAAGFVCSFQGCTAPPFQTQYLLNSHGNVHSSARPHYCPVNGCPRAEGGKGFKRKNEMIRHGLVHESPGYVCPFCPDREHKYPRPDNLQRHVRVHHVDKDKDDALLREVLAQRPDGPNRGRRRRGGA